MKKVVFHLKRFWNGRDLREEIKSGKKRIEYRDASIYWLTRLLKNPKPRRAWFVFGYPKNNLPRFEADIISIIPFPFRNQIETHFSNVIEIIKQSQKRIDDKY